MAEQQPINTLFLDRDGVINVFDEDNFVNRVEDFRFFPKALDAFQLLTKYFDRILVVTNQAGIGYGYMKKETLEAIHVDMVSSVVQAGGKIDGVYYCPDRVSKASPCRKPNSGMALQARRDFPEIVFPDAWMVGDRDSDIEFGKRLNMHTVRIVNGDIDEALKSPIQADYYFSSLFEFANWIENSL